MTDPKRERLEGIAESLRVRFGDHALIHKPPGGLLPPALSTGFPRLDQALGAGGLPRGHLSLFQGVPTSGATTLVLRTLAGIRTEPTAYFDLTHSFDPDYAARCGVIVSELLVVRPALADLQGALEAFIILAEVLSAAVFDLSLIAHLSPPDRSLWRRFGHTLRRSACAGMVILSKEAPFLQESASVCLKVRPERWLRRRHEVRGLRAQVEISRDRFGSPGKRVGLTLGGMG